MSHLIHFNVTLVVHEQSEFMGNGNDIVKKYINGAKTCKAGQHGNFIPLGKEKLIFYLTK